MLSFWFYCCRHPVRLQATPFQTGLLLGQSSGRNLPEVEDQFGQEQTAVREEAFPNWGCQQQLAQSVQAQLAEHSPIDFGGNLLAQILPKREQICRIFSSLSGNLNNCLGRRPGPIHPLFLLLQTVCHQFAETLEAHGQCVAELNLTKLEGQCAQACHRHAESQLPQLRVNANSQKVGKLRKSSASSSSPSSLGSEALCQLAFCAVNCFGSQISECAEEEAAEGTAAQGRTTSDPAVLKAMFSQISGLQMLLGLQQSQTPLQAQMQLLQGQVPSECAQLIGKAVSSANFIAEHDEMPGGVSIGVAAASSDGLQESVPNEQQQYEGRE